MIGPRPLLVMGHCFPYTDPDSVLGSVALAAVLSARGLPAEAVLLHGFTADEAARRIVCLAGASLPRVVDAADLADHDLVLVDHNNPGESFGRLGAAATPFLVVDHHLDEGFEAQVKVIEKVGSACTLVARMALEPESTTGWAGPSAATAQTPAVARALVYGIVTDTLGLRSAKTTDLDRQMVDRLYGLFDMGETLADVAASVTPVMDVPAMTVPDILRAGLKEYGGGALGIAVLVVGDDAYRSRLDEVAAAAASLPYRLYGLMVARQHTGDTEVYWFDRAGTGLPPYQHAPGILSRAQNVVPAALAALGKAT